MKRYLYIFKNLVLEDFIRIKVLGFYYEIKKYLILIK